MHLPKVMRELMEQGNEAQFEASSRYDLYRVKEMNAYISLRGSQNIYEYSAVAPE